MKIIYIYQYNLFSFIQNGLLHQLMKKKKRNYIIILEETVVAFASFTLIVSVPNYCPLKIEREIFQKRRNPSFGDNCIYRLEWNILLKGWFSFFKLCVSSLST